MAEKEFLSSFKQPSLFKKFTTENTRKEKKQIRLILFLLLGFAGLSIGLASLYREVPNLLKRVNEPTTVSSHQFITTPTPTPTPKFELQKQEVVQTITPLRGKYGIYFQDLESKDHFEINGKDVFPAASLIKLPVMITLFREADAGRIDLETIYKLKAADKRDGAGSLVYKPVGFEITYRKMAELMGKQSDNTAFYVLANNILGPEKIQATIDALGMRNTSFTNQETTPEDIGLLFRKLYGERIVAEKSQEEIYSNLSDTIWEDRIPASIPKEIKVVHKIGTLIGVISDAGIVFAKKPFVLVIMNEEVNEIEAKKALPEITKKIYDMTQGVGN